MRVRKKVIINWILRICLGVMILGSVSYVALAKQNKELEESTELEGSTELLIVIDNSGSMQKTETFLNNVTTLISRLVESRCSDVNVTYLIFNEQTYFLEDASDIAYAGGRETCILQGLEETDKWMEEKIERGIKVKTLLISDLFSSRYLEGDEICVYNKEKAIKEQERISQIEEKWTKWYKQSKANIVVWTWESLCKTEDSKNTIKRLEKITDKECEDIISNGYQVKFFYDSAVRFKSDDIGEGFIKKTVQSFERLVSTCSEEWDSIWISSKSWTTIKPEKNGIIYIYVPKQYEVAIQKLGEEGFCKPIVEQVYMLEGGEQNYRIRKNSNKDQEQNRNSKVFVFNVPGLTWRGKVEEQEKLQAFLKPSAMLDGGWGTESEYVCKLIIYKEGEICEKIKEDILPFKDGAYVYVDDGTVSEHGGKYRFNFYINGEKVESKIKYIK